MLAGRTTGYRHHPQLRRFAAQPDPRASVAAYLEALAAEADARGYRFGRSRIDEVTGPVPPIPVTDGQLAHEWQHLLAKVAGRNPHLLTELEQVRAPRPHPVFFVVPGPVEDWEATRG